MKILIIEDDQWLANTINIRPGMGFVLSTQPF